MMSKLKKHLKSKVRNKTKKRKGPNSNEIKGDPIKQKIQNKRRKEIQKEREKYILVKERSYKEDTKEDPINLFIRKAAANKWT